MGSRQMLAVAAILLASAAAGCGTDAMAGGAYGTKAAQPATSGTSAHPGSPSPAALAVPATGPASPSRSSAATASGHSATGTVPQRPSVTWGNPVFADYFSGTKLGNHWFAYNSPRAKTPRTPQSVQVKNGYLNLIAHYQSPYGYVGGGVGYWPDQTYGRWVVRFRADAGAGSEPVILLWPKGAWPADGEVDVVGLYNNARHGGGIYLIMGAVSHHTGYHIPPTVDFTQWHTMAVDWLPDHLTFWLDGKAIWTVKRGAGSSNFVPNTPFHLALQLDAGCDSGCKPNAQTPPQVRMQIDWVKIYVPH